MEELNGVHTVITELFCQDSCAVCKIYFVKANGFNSQQIASAYSVDIASGDSPETCGDTLLDHPHGAAHVFNELIILGYLLGG